MDVQTGTGSAATRAEQMREQVLLDMYKEQVTHGRHTETQRLEVTKFLIALSASLVSVMGALKFSIHCLPLCLTLIYVGVFGRRLSRTYVDRLDGHMNRARGFRKAIDATTCHGEIQDILDTNPVVKNMRVRSFWIQVNGAILILGILCLLWNIGAIWARLENQNGSITTKIAAQLAFAETANPQEHVHPASTEVPHASTSSPSKNK